MAKHASNQRSGTMGCPFTSIANSRPTGKYIAACVIPRRSRQKPLLRLLTLSLHLPVIDRDSRSGMPIVPLW